MTTSSGNKRVRCLEAKATPFGTVTNGNKRQRVAQDLSESTPYAEFKTPSEELYHVVVPRAPDDAGKLCSRFACDWIKPASGCVTDGVTVYYEGNAVYGLEHTFEERVHLAADRLHHGTHTYAQCQYDPELFVTVGYYDVSHHKFWITRQTPLHHWRRYDLIASKWKNDEHGLCTQEPAADSTVYELLHGGSHNSIPKLEAFKVFYDKEAHEMSDGYEDVHGLYLGVAKQPKNTMPWVSYTAMWNTSMFVRWWAERDGWDALQEMKKHGVYRDYVHPFLNNQLEPALQQYREVEHKYLYDAEYRQRALERYTMERLAEEQRK